MAPFLLAAAVGSFMDYALPRADDSLETALSEVPTNHPLASRRRRGGNAPALGVIITPCRCLLISALPSDMPASPERLAGDPRRQGQL